MLANLRSGGFAGRIIPVNLRDETVQGLPAWPSIAAVQEPVDLAVVATPADTVLDILRDCAAHGVGVAVVITAGFREVGERRTRAGGRPARVAGGSPAARARSELPRLDAPRGPPQRDLRVRDGRRGSARVHLALGGAGRGHSRLGARAPHGILDVREPRQSSRHQRGRPPRGRGGGRRDAGHRGLPGRRGRWASVPRGARTRRGGQARGGAEGGPQRRGRARGLLAHGGDRRIRCGVRRSDQAGWGGPRPKRGGAVRSRSWRLRASRWRAAGDW